MGIKSLAEKLQSRQVIKSLGIYFIVSATYLLIKVADVGFHKLGWIPYYLIVSSIALIIIAIQIFELKEWSRKAIILFSVYMLLTTNMLFFPYMFNKLTAVVVQPNQTLKYIIILFYTYSTINQLLTIYFFTRPKVKEQFK